jgi:chemotaxis protein methyltransferase CheR
VLLTNTAQVDAAEEICGRLLAGDELNAAAHYLMAVCQEHRGDCLSAAEHDQAAIYLDGEFAFPHLHMGLLAKRLGDLGTARQEFTAAVDLLGKEDASRIWLFGGGFEREALLRFCQSNLQAGGGQT